MSFSEEICAELAGIAVKKPCCKRSFAEGLLLCADPSDRQEIRLRLGRESVAGIAEELIRQVFGKSPDVRRVGLCGHTFYDFSFSSPACRKYLLRAEDAKDDPEAIPTHSCEGCRAAFLRGCFLAFGTVSDPAKSAHLEFRMTGGRGADLLCGYLLREGLEPRRAVRKDDIGIYFKNLGSIEDLLTLMGSHSLIFDVMNTRIEHDIRNNENRATNCVAKNIEKMIRAGARQMDAINRLLDAGRLDSLPEPLHATALLRYQNPDVPLDELAKRHDPPISKSGLNHRLQKIIELSEELTERGKH